MRTVILKELLDMKPPCSCFEPPPLLLTSAASTRLALGFASPREWHAATKGQKDRQLSVTCADTKGIYLSINIYLSIYLSI